MEREFKSQAITFDRQIKELKDEAARSESAAGMYAVRYGKYTFSSIAEVGAWAEVTFESGFPFGAFVDVYSMNIVQGCSSIYRAKEYGDAQKALFVG